MVTKTFRKSHTRKIKTKNSATGTKTIRVKSTIAKVGKKSSSKRKKS